MRAAALSPPRPSPGPAAACCRGKVGNKFCFTAVIVLSPNHAVYTSPARTARTPLLPVRCAPHAPQPFRETAAVARSEYRSSDGAAHTLSSLPLSAAQKIRAPRRLPQAAPTRSHPPLPLPLRLVAMPLPAIATIILLLSLPARSPAARGGRRFGPDTQHPAGSELQCVPQAPRFASASLCSEPEAPARQLRPKRRARPGQGGGCSRKPTARGAARALCRIQFALRREQPLQSAARA